MQLEGSSEGRVGAIVVAAGSSSRMGGPDKIFADLNGRPVVAHSVGVFEASPSIQHIALVVAEASLGRARELVARQGWTKVVKVCTGGARRQDSVAAGLSQLADCDWVLIHDGARPLVSLELVERGLAAALRWGAAIPGVPVKDTIKVVEDGVVRAGLDRSSLAAVQTPQIFKSAIIREAYARFGNDVTDDAGLMEMLGQPVGVFEGSDENIKITTQLDLTLARLVLEQRERESSAR